VPTVRHVRSDNKEITDAFEKMRAAVPVSAAPVVGLLDKVDAYGHCRV
jgi:hypothetical protein